MSSVLQHNIEGHETPGSKHFEPFKVTPELEEYAAMRLSHYPDDQKRSAVLMLIHKVQHLHGFIGPEAIDWIASKIECEPMKVVEVVTFYPGIRQSAPGKFHIRVCRTLSCAMAGSGELMDKLADLTGIDRSKADPHHEPISVSPDGTFSLEFAECLASCGTGPVCLVNDDFHEDVPPEKAQALLDSYAAK